MLATMLAPWLARRGIHYGWAIAAVTFLTMLATSACVGLPGVLIVPLRGEFGWDTGAISGPLALRIALYGLVGPFAAALMLRYGVRAVVCTALALIMTGLGLASFMTEIWQLWLTWGLIVGFATGLTAMVLGATVATRWFTARRGLVLGLLAASTATGQLLFLPAAAWLAQQAGWRVAVIPAVVACAVCLVLVLLILRDHPGDLGIPPYGDTALIPPPRRAEAGSVARLSVTALADASRSRIFWLLFGTFFVCGLSTNGLVQTHFIPLCHDFGMPNVEAASVLALMGVFDFFGTIASGWLSDRYDNRWLLFWSLCRPGRQPGGAALLQFLLLRPDRVRRVLRPGLHRHRAADRPPHRPDLRPRAGGHGVRLDLRRPPAWRRDGGLGCGRLARRAGELPAGVFRRRHCLFCRGTRRPRGAAGAGGRLTKTGQHPALDPPQRASCVRATGRLPRGAIISEQGHTPADCRSPASQLRQRGILAIRLIV